MSERGSNPKDIAGQAKAPLALVPGTALVRMAEVMRVGAQKYGSFNWRTIPVRYTVYVEAAMRHLLSALDGEDIDPESKQPHIAHAMACCAILLDALEQGTCTDNRVVPGETARLIATLAAQRKAEQDGTHTPDASGVFPCEPPPLSFESIWEKWRKAHNVDA